LFELKVEDYRRMGMVLGAMGASVGGLGVYLVFLGGGSAVLILFLLSWGTTFSVTALYARKAMQHLQLLRGY
jgi:hypothetical protein